MKPETYDPKQRTEYAIGWGADAVSSYAADVEPWIGSLDSDDADLLELRFCHHKSTDDIADILGDVGPVAVLYRIRRALERVRYLRGLDGLGFHESTARIDLDGVLETLDLDILIAFVQTTSYRRTAQAVGLREGRVRDHVIRVIPRALAGHDRYARMLAFATENLGTFAKQVHRQHPRLARAKISEADAIEIRAASKRGSSIATLAERYGLTRCSVYFVLTGRTWRRIKP